MFEIVPDVDVSLETIQSTMATIATNGELTVALNDAAPELGGASVTLAATCKYILQLLFLPVFLFRSL